MVIVLAHIGLIGGTAWALSAVDLFFVLSGYLITNSILKNRDAPRFLSVFFTRRALRIWPAYYLALVACLLISRTVSWDHPPDAWPFYLTFTQNVHQYFNIPQPLFSKMFLHTWTLAIEEQFYLLWPVLLFRAGPRMRLAVILTFAAIPPIMRSWNYAPFLLLTRSDGLALGSLLAVILSDRERVARHATTYAKAFAILGLLVLIVPELIHPRLALSGATVDAAMVYSPWFITRVSVVYFGLSGFVLCLQGKPALTLLRTRWLSYLGTISYGLYLYHPMVFGALPSLCKRIIRRSGMTPSTLLVNLVLLAICFALAEISRRYVEGPILALKDRLAFPTAESDRGYRGPHKPLVRSRSTQDG